MKDKWRKNRLQEKSYIFQNNIRKMLVKFPFHDIWPVWKGEGSVAFAIRMSHWQYIIPLKKGIDGIEYNVSNELDPMCQVLKQSLSYLIISYLIPATITQKYFHGNTKVDVIIYY